MYRVGEEKILGQGQLRAAQSGCRSGEAHSIGNQSRKAGLRLHQVDERTLARRVWTICKVILCCVVCRDISLCSAGTWPLVMGGTNPIEKCRRSLQMYQSLRTTAIRRNALRQSVWPLKTVSLLRRHWKKRSDRVECRTSWRAWENWRNFYTAPPAMMHFLGKWWSMSL